MTMFVSHRWLPDCFVNLLTNCFHGDFSLGNTLRVETAGELPKIARLPGRFVNKQFADISDRLLLATRRKRLETFYQLNLNRGHL